MVPRPRLGEGGGGGSEGPYPLERATRLWRKIAWIGVFESCLLLWRSVWPGDALMAGKTDSSTEVPEGFIHVGLHMVTTNTDGSGHLHLASLYQLKLEKKNPNPVILLDRVTHFKGKKKKKRVKILCALQKRGSICAWTMYPLSYYCWNHIMLSGTSLNGPPHIIIIVFSDI